MRCVLLLVGLHLLAAPAFAATTALEHLAAYLTGTFSTTDQARADNRFRDLTLHVTPIWGDRSDGPWLYSEQSLTEVPDHPYRQRICQLAARPNGALEIRLFDLPDPIAATGAWKDPALLAKITPAGLATGESCTLILHAQPDGSFQGGTEGKGCLSTLQGASHTTIQMSVSEQQTITWERGYNADDRQVWGSDRGGLIFKKQ